MGFCYKGVMILGTEVEMEGDIFLDREIYGILECTLGRSGASCLRVWDSYRKLSLDHNIAYPYFIDQVFQDEHVYAWALLERLGVDLFVIRCYSITPTLCVLFFIQDNIFLSLLILNEYFRTSRNVKCNIYRVYGL